MKNGFYIQNASGVMGRHPAVLRMEAYDANKQRIGKVSGPVEYNNGMRLISADHIGSADHIYLLVFYDSPNYNPPPGIGIISGPHGSGGGGGFSISIGGSGFGVSGSGSVTVTEAFSQPSLVAKMELKTYYHEPKLGWFGNTPQISAMAITTILDDNGDDKLVPVFVKDFLTNEMEGPSGWSSYWSWGWSPPLIES